MGHPQHGIAVEDGISISYPVGRAIAQSMAEQDRVIPDEEALEEIRTKVERRVAAVAQERCVDPWIRDIIDSEVRAWFS